MESMEENFKEIMTFVKNLVGKAAHNGHEGIKKMQEEMKEISDMAKSEFLQKSLQILFKLLEDPTNCKDVIKLFGKLKSADPMVVLEAFIESTGTKQKQAKTPSTLDELRSIIREAAREKKNIKAVSTRYSGLWTDIGDSEGIIIDTSRLKKAFHSIECLKDGEMNKKEYSNFEAGITMGDIQEELWPSNCRTTRFPETYRVLENATSGASLSLAGTVSTGAHGNGVCTGIVADAVMSFQMFTIDKNWRLKRYQIEPSNGITDRNKFETKHRFDDDQFELIQDDVQFNASVVNIGCLGVVYSYVLKTVPGFYLREKRTVYKWSVAKDIIKRLYDTPPKQLYNFQVIGSPYEYKLDPLEDEDYRVLISTLTLSKPEDIWHRSAGHSRLPMKVLDEALVAAGNSTPHFIPYVMHYTLMYLEHDEIVLNAVEALNTLAGVVAGKFSDVRTSECIMKLNNSQRVIDIMETLHTLYADIQSKNKNQLVNVPIAVRFTARSKKNMAMAYDKLDTTTITVEQSIINKTYGADDTLKKFREKMFDKYEGRPHWGLLHELNADRVEKLYDGECLRVFKKIQNKFDPNSVFVNAFAKNVFGFGTVSPVK